MHAVVIIILCAATLSDFVMSLWSAPVLFKLLPEELSVVVTVLVLLEGVRGGFSLVSPKYWIVFGLLALIIVAGVLSNGVGAGPIVSGMRVYVRALPLFLLPAVSRFTNTQIRQQMKLLLAIGVLQLPIACYQRWVIYSEGRFSGDDVVGTMDQSGPLSIVLVCIFLVVIACYMQKRIGRLNLLLLFLALLFPTTINETKVTVFILPVGLLTTLIVGSPRGKRLRVFALGLTLLAVFTAILIPVYDAMNVRSHYKNERNIEDFFSNPEVMNNYMNLKHDAATVGTKREVGRGDALRVPLDYLSRDPIRLAFGLGLGNATHSNLGGTFVGDYYPLFARFTITAFTVFILEFGLLGTSLVFLLYILMFFDALAVARADTSIVGSLAVGWTGVVLIMALSTFYILIQIFPPLSYLYWYFGGVIAARRVELALAGARARLPLGAVT